MYLILVKKVWMRDITRWQAQMNKDGCLVWPSKDEALKEKERLEKCKAMVRMFRVEEI